MRERNNKNERAKWKNDAFTPPSHSQSRLTTTTATNKGVRAVGKIRRMILAMLANHQFQHLVLLEQIGGRHGGAAAAPEVELAGAPIAALGAAEGQPVKCRFRHHQFLDSRSDTAVPIIRVNKAAIVRVTVGFFRAQASLFAAAGELHHIAQRRNVGRTLNDNIAIVAVAATRFSAREQAAEVLLGETQNEVRVPQKEDVNAEN